MAPKERRFWGRDRWHGLEPEGDSVVDLCRPSPLPRVRPLLELLFPPAALTPLNPRTRCTGSACCPTVQPDVECYTYLLLCKSYGIQWGFHTHVGVYS